MLGSKWAFPYVFRVNNYQGFELWPNSGNSEPQNHVLRKWKITKCQNRSHFPKTLFRTAPKGCDFHDHQVNMSMSRSKSLALMSVLNMLGSKWVFPYVSMVNHYHGLELWPNSGNSEPQIMVWENDKSQNVRIFHTSRMLCELLYVLSVSISHAFNCLPAISAGTTGKTLTCTVSTLTCTFWNLGLSLVHFHKQVTQESPQRARITLIIWVMSG